MAIYLDYMFLLHVQRDGEMPLVTAVNVYQWSPVANRIPILDLEKSSPGKAADFLCKMWG